MNQRDQVVAYIQEHGFITSWDAYKDLGITQLATRIFELKERGYHFRKERRQGKGRKHWDEYYIDER